MASGGRSTRIETKNRAGIRVVRTDVTPNTPTRKVDVTVSRSDSGSRRWSSSNIWGPRGQRILPADFPLEQLDFNAPRGTYIDILV